MIVGPDGSLRSEVLCEKEGIVAAEIDVSESLEHKQHHDMAGYYNRLDIFSVHVRRARPEPAYFSEMRSPARLDSNDGVLKADQGDESSRAAAE
jgi:hypothetical protein